MLKVVSECYTNGYQKQRYQIFHIHTPCLELVGGIVINDKNEILVVVDRYTRNPNNWKLPGGYVEPEEDIVDAGIREIREETGIETLFESVVAIRHLHGSNFGCSDLYFVLAMKPTTTRLTPCPQEIAKIQWMPVAEFLEHPTVQESYRQYVKAFIHYKEAGIKFTCLRNSVTNPDYPYCLYTVEKEISQAKI